MASSFGHLRVLDGSLARREIDLASELFHRINRIIPETQKVLTVPPACSARDAVSTMRQHGYSQLPVVKNGEVLGVFSYRSFAKAAARPTLDELKKEQCAPGDLLVDECLEEFEFARLKDDYARVFDAMERDNGILIGTQEKLVGILTPMDFLRYLNQVAGPFVLISEIELALRALIQIVLPDEKLAVLAGRVLAHLPGDADKRPDRLEDMTFDTYHKLISHGDSWELFAEVFGGTRARMSGKLRAIGVIRNDVFHFKRPITLEDHRVLLEHRNWLLIKVNQARSPDPKGIEP